MAGTVKKRKRRYKNTIRKTFGTFFLVSAITVAAIPVDDLQAEVAQQERKMKVTVDMEKCRIPIVDEKETIYTTGDGRFQFAYVRTNDTAASNKVAVILGYDSQQLEDGTLVIPETVDAYLKYSENLGTAYGYCAVGKMGNFLYYEVVEEKLDDQGNVVLENDLSSPMLDESNNPVLDPVSGEIMYNKKPVMEKKYKPCFFEDYSRWSNVELDQLYYIKGKKTVNGELVDDYVKTDESTVQRIQAATVVYIGNQTLKAGEGENAGTWSIISKEDGGYIDTPEEGIFRGEKAGNIETLYVGKSLSGIGNYAFSNCTNLSSIKLENGLDTIGNYAFSGCVNLEKVSVDIGAMITTIGDHAFYKCQGLKEFVMPRQIANVGDSAFEACSSLSRVELCGEGKNVQLSKLGYDVFKDCSSLKEVVFPVNYTENDLDISMWEGCSSLEHIQILNNKVNFVEGANSSFGFEEFVKTVPDNFYFEGPKDAPLFDTATKYSIAYKYGDDDIYEVIIQKDNLKAVFRANGAGELIYSDIPAGMSEVEIPKQIGPYKIKIIGSTGFQGNCALEKIVIPSSIEEIKTNAFKGCHNLKTVIFEEPVMLTTIENDAFLTQDVKVHKSSCSNPKIEKTPVLQFVGKISKDSVPFMYAMDPGNNINVGSQQRAYITYYGNWPSNLQVEYNPDTQMNELVNYMTFKELMDFEVLTTEKAAVEKYPYMTSSTWADYVEAATDALKKYDNPALSQTMTDYEREILNATLNIVLPEGIESIKEGLFTSKETDPTEPAKDKTITANGLICIPDECFKDCKNLTAFYGTAGLLKVGERAFENCIKLNKVNLPTTVTEMGTVPFKGCESLNSVYLAENPIYSCKDGIIYRTDATGDGEENKEKVIFEFLKGRKSGVVVSEEIEGVSGIEKGAFDGTNVSSVDLSKTTIKEIPSNAFSNTSKLYMVTMPKTWDTISDDAFSDSYLQTLDIPNQKGYIAPKAFDRHDSGLTFCCEEGSVARGYAKNNGITVTDKVVVKTHNVIFIIPGEDPITQEVEDGKDPVYPEVKEREGYVFKEWSELKQIGNDWMCEAIYEPEDIEAKKLTITFVDDDGDEIEKRKFLPTEKVTYPDDPEKEGKIFKGWKPEITQLTKDITVVAQYEDKNGFVVTFYDSDRKTILSSQKVEFGKGVIEPKDPERSGYKFVGWDPDIKELQNVTEDIKVIAMYDRLDSSDNSNQNNSSNNNDSNNNQNNNQNSNNQNNQNNSNQNNSNNNNSNNNANNQSSTKLYTLSVKEGSGSGSFGAGTQNIIVANDPAAGMEFSHWTVSPDSVKIASKNMSATVVTMPETDVVVTANYKKKDASSNNNSSSNNNGSSNNNTGNTNNNSNNSSNTGNNNSSNTVNGNNNGNSNSTGNNGNNGSNNGNNNGNNGSNIEISKNGLSNTAVVSATINGSSDDFVLKISENSEASLEVVKALQDKYGNLEGIKYFPMDISLYDATGKNKITDTTGLSINVTLPIPDSLITYAGNNKIAAVKDGKIEELSKKFTTINGVPCISFTAEHFSPYTIYVDTNNLTAGTTIDQTPKTGDGIHPKWFLSIGLACVSIVLFTKKDKRKLQKAKA